MGEKQGARGGARHSPSDTLAGGKNLQASRPAGWIAFLECLAHTRCGWVADTDDAVDVIGHDHPLIQLGMGRIAWDALSHGRSYRLISVELYFYIHDLAGQV